MTQRNARRRAATTVLVALVGGYSILGWCPPPPGAFLPDRVTYDLGSVEVGSTAEVSVSFLLNPLYSDPSFGVFSISASPYLFLGNQENSFSIDLQRTTCVPGAIITTTSGCTLTIRFTPTSPGRKALGELFLNACQSIFASCATSMSIGSINTFTGIGVALPVPALSQLGIVLLAMLMVALAWSTRHRAKGSSN